MNWQQIEGSWRILQGKAKERWGKLSDDDLKLAAGKRDELIGRIQRAYGVSKEEAEKQVEDFGRTLH